jgi:hypothetical protein
MFVAGRKVVPKLCPPERDITILNVTNATLNSSKEVVGRQYNVSVNGVG